MLIVDCLWRKAERDLNHYVFLWISTYHQWGIKFKVNSETFIYCFASGRFCLYSLLNLLQILNKNFIVRDYNVPLKNQILWAIQKIDVMILK